jgi:hypothetical protein
MVQLPSRVAGGLFERLLVSIERWGFADQECGFGDASEKNAAEDAGQMSLRSAAEGESPDEGWRPAPAFLFALQCNARLQGGFIAA